MDRRRAHILAYFYSWVGLVVVAAILNALNVNWQLSHPVQGVAVVVVLTLLEASALEFLMMTVVSLAFSGIGGMRRLHIPREYDHQLSLLINYNLLAHTEEDIENAYQHMYDSYMTNLAPDVSAVLLSATNSPALKLYELRVRDNYRALVRRTLLEEGAFLLAGQTQHVDSFRLRYFWKSYLEGGPEEELLEEKLEEIVERAATEFMCIHRVSRVLKKCGQYQDLLLLADGHTTAFTYTEPALYSSLARPFDQPLFYDSPDVSNIHNRKFDYTLIMDSDTLCPPGTAQELLAVAAAHPERGIIQPAIKMSVKDTDTIYMHLELWRQRLNEPLSRSLAILYGQWGFYGKGMIKNKLYIQRMIGTRQRPIEMVPVDVLSHDTYEAAVLKPLYVDSLYFEEEPSYNYISWHIRERRWNQGELILSQYFWPIICGNTIGWLRRLFDKRNYVRTRVRTPCHFGLVSTHVAHSALRSMFMKPMLLIYVLMQIGVVLHRPFLPLAGVLFLVCIFPKFAITNWANARFAAAETLASILQYTPEAFVGSVRLGQAIFATICKSCTENWTPQRVVEEDMRNSNPFSSSLRHLWAYSFVALVCLIVFAIVDPNANLIYFMFSTIIVIPLFTGFTSLTPDARLVRIFSRRGRRRDTETPLVGEEATEATEYSKVEAGTSRAQNLSSIEHSVPGKAKVSTSTSSQMNPRAVTYMADETLPSKRRARRPRPPPQAPSQVLISVEEEEAVEEEEEVEEGVECTPQFTPTGRQVTVEAAGTTRDPPTSREGSSSRARSNTVCVGVDPAQDLISPVEQVGDRQQNLMQRLNVRSRKATSKVSPSW